MADPLQTAAWGGVDAAPSSPNEVGKFAAKHGHEADQCFLAPVDAFAVHELAKIRVGDLDSNAVQAPVEFGDGLDPAKRHHVADVKVHFANLHWWAFRWIWPRFGWPCLGRLAVCFQR